MAQIKGKAEILKPVILQVRQERLILAPVIHYQDVGEMLPQTFQNREEVGPFIINGDRN
jgi:hypothetical protein